MTALSPEDRERLLAPCACGHTINDHGTLACCWTCEDNGDECTVTFEDILAERIADLLDQRGKDIAAAIRADLVRRADGSLNAFAMGQDYATRIAETFGGES